MSDLQTSADQPLALVRRRDLVATVVPFRGKQYWSIKDPISLRYFQLREEEYFILRQLDGQTSLNEIKQKFENHFVPQRVTLAQLQSYLGMLHREGLLVALTAGQGDELRVRHQRQRRTERIRWLSNPLAIRFRGIDPERLLAALYPFCRWMFSWPAIMGCLLLVVSALSLVVVQFDTLQSRLPDFRSFFGFENALWIAFAICLAKVLHELGHGISCRHFGGECHELGVMFLVFTPCLYCNVSDAWMLPNRWHRIAISAAGMWVELVLASICTLIWWNSEPGLLNAICLNIMFVCSLSTVLFNGNPLLRYDGYFILADLVEVPNLRQQAMSQLRRWASWFFLGLDDNQRVTQDRRAWLLGSYAIASTIYRWFVVLAILYFCRMILKPYRMHVLADCLAILVTASMIVTPLVQLGKMMMNPIRQRQIRWLRFVATFALVVALIVGALIVPLPYELSVVATIQPRGADNIYVSFPGGTLLQSAESGQYVQRGDVIGRLVNDDLELQIQRLQGRRAVQKTRIQNLKDLRFSDTQTGTNNSSSKIPTAQKTLQAIERALQGHLAQRDRLTLRATKTGTILPPATIKKRTPLGELDSWTDTPLERKNLGAFLQAGDTFCLIGDRSKREALLVIEQGEVETIRVGQAVRVKLDQSPGHALQGKIVEIAETSLSNLPPELAVGRKLPTHIDDQGKAKPLETSYVARVRFDDEQELPDLVIGATGHARISLGYRSIAQRVGRYLAQTFHFKL